MYKYNNKHLGENLIESAVIFETALSKILCAQARYLDILISRNAPVHVILKVNQQICCIVCCLKDVQKTLASNIDNGINKLSCANTNVKNKNYI